jgi:alpha-N-arabinofuranosidase
MVNAIAPIFTRPDGLFLQTIYHPLRLYAELVQEVALDPFVDSPEYELPASSEASDMGGRTWNVADLGPFKLLDVSATRDEQSSTLCIGVVNRDRDNAITASIELTGGTATRVQAFEVNGASPSLCNSFDDPTAVSVRSHAPAVRAGTLSYEFPAHSVTVLRIELGPSARRVGNLLRSTVPLNVSASRSYASAGATPGRQRNPRREAR